MCPNPQFLADLVTFTEEILNGKLHFLCSDCYKEWTEWIHIQIIFGKLVAVYLSSLLSNFYGIISYSFGKSHANIWRSNASEGRLLTHFSRMFHFYNSWKRQKIFGFLTFSGVIEMEQTKMGQVRLSFHRSLV